MNPVVMNLSNQTQIPNNNTTKNLKNNNIYKVNFKSQDDFVSQMFNDNQQKPQVQRVQQYDPYAEARKKAKSQERRNKITTAVSIGAGLAIIASVILTLKQMKGGGPAAFNIKNLEFKDLSKDESIFDLKTSKSLHPKVKTFFTNLIEKGEIDKEIAERAGILGEAGTNSVLLLGGSGVGKTEVIRAYAKATNADYVAIKLSDFANSYINGTSKNITEMINTLIKRAKENPDKQLVISLDEVDALVKVTRNEFSDEISKNRQSLLTGMDELLKLPNIKLFTSSNANVKDLDGAFLRRCGYNFEVPMPDKEQLKEAFKFQLRKCKGATEDNGKFFDNNTKLDNFLNTMVNRKCAFGDVANISKAAKDDYALDMKRKKNKTLKFDVTYLTDALNKIETTAGEKAAREGSTM